MFDFIVIGAGISGTAFARMLQQRGITNFLVLEGESSPGGLCRTQNHKGHEFDIGGGHFLYTKIQKVYDFIYEHLNPNALNQFDRISKIRLDSHILDYPLEANLNQLPKEMAQTLLQSALESGEARNLPKPNNFKEWIRWRLGQGITKTYMFPYNEKIWGIDLAEIGTDWLHKLPPIDLEKIVALFNNEQPEGDLVPSHPIFFYPKAGGFQTIFDAIYNPIEPHVHLNEMVDCLEKTSDGWRVNKRYDARVVINTAPWPKLFKGLDSPSDLKNEFNELKHMSLVTSLWQSNYEHNWHWNYVPGEEEYHRSFYLANYAKQSKAGGIMTETNLNRWPGEHGQWNYPPSPHPPITQFVNEYAYPIATQNRTKAIETICNHYAPKGLHGLGRWGQWRHFNSDICIHEAMQLIETLC